MRYLLLFAASLLPVFASLARGNDLFNPYAFQQRVATCPGINRADNSTVDLLLRMLLQLRLPIL